ncbi:DKNYY domain-containing protein [Aquimarina sp. 2201CG5-10]|uniref:DKNYY domain-containing protein n=1 Tax=Aquimarina callyspongiae TaxID=3098150 RepID=UPI002AB38A04|nr:DKNYY domain-containing protein [Aquimarina sp. 2201CG5-10]MDY8137719.1 DKNYY domain-containing protein [Aquimarina sp. 2201CG5-10]
MIVAIVFISIASLCIYGIYRFFNPFGKEVDKELSDSYYYTRDNQGIIYSSMGNWFSLGKREMKVDFETFQVLGRDYAKDKNSAYYKSRAINSKIDVPSFTVKSGYVPIDKNHVYILVDDLYYLDDTDKEGFKILEDADPESYEQLNYTFAKDKKSVFRNNKKTAVVDRNSFEILNEYFCKDINGVYYYWYDKPLKKIDVNLSEVIVLTSLYIRDDKHLFVYLDNRGSEIIDDIIKIPFNDHNEIKFFNATSIIKVDDKIYYEGDIIKEADAYTFEEVEYGYTKDANHVFFLGKIIEGADPKTFKYNDRSYIFSDKNHVYDAGKIVEKKK